MHMLRKLLALLISTMILMPQFAASESFPELLINGGFEAVTNTRPDGWSGTQNEWGANSSVSVSTENVNSGKNAVKIVNGDNIKPWINRQTAGLISGATYEISFWLHAELGKNAASGVGAYMEFYRGASTSSGGVGTKSILYFSSTNARWTFVSGQFVLPSDATMVKLYLRLYSDGVAYFDDVSLKLAEIDKFTFETSHVFHYADDVQGTAKVALHAYYYDSALSEKAKANFYIYDEKNVIAKKLSVPFADGAAVFTYKVSDLLKKKGHAYRLYIEALDENGAVADTFEQNIYKYDRPSYLDKDGNFLNEDGTITKPVVAFHLNTEDYAKARQAGFTMFQIGYGSAPVANTYQRETVLDESEKHGLRGLFSLYLGMKAACHPDNIENTKKIVEMYKDDPRFFGWIVQDEPLGSGITEDGKKWLELSYKTIRDIDSKHPIFLTDYSSYVFRETVKYCDVFIPNSYGLSYNGVKTYTEEAVKYACARPVIPNIGAYARGTGTEAELPTGKQVKHFVYQAFSGGARGVSVYSFSDVIKKPSKVEIYNTKLWEPLCQVLNEEYPYLYDLFLQGGTAEETDTVGYSMRRWTKPDGDYYCLISKSDAAQSVVIHRNKAPGVTLLSHGNQSTFSMGENTVSVSLASGESVLFKIYSIDNQVHVSKNGFGISKLETGYVRVTAPATTKHIYACFYKEENGREVLQRIMSCEGNTMTLSIFEADLSCKLKVFAWDDNLSPSAKPYLVPNL